MKFSKFCKKNKQLIYVICLILVLHEFVSITILYMKRNLKFVSISEKDDSTTRSLAVIGNSQPNPAGQERGNRGENGNSVLQPKYNHVLDRNGTKGKKKGINDFAGYIISSADTFSTALELTKPAYLGPGRFNSTFRSYVTGIREDKNITGSLKNLRELHTSETLKGTTRSKDDKIMVVTNSKPAKMKNFETLEKIGRTDRRIIRLRKFKNRRVTKREKAHSTEQGRISKESIDTCIASFPLSVNMTDLAEMLLRGEVVHVSPVNTHPFEYIHRPRNLCAPHNYQRRLRLLILVKSAAPNFQLRHVMRNTWGKLVKNYGMIYAFLLGFSPLDQQNVDSEDAKFHDIIQESFIDYYRNNTYKTIMGYNWVVKYCSVAERVLFLDDDVFLNLNLLNKYLMNLDELGVTRLFSGSFQSVLLPHRHNTSKWYMPYEDYPCSFYPQFISGLAILVSMDVVKMFQLVFPYVKYLYTDDVWLAIVARKLGIKPMLNPYITDHISNMYEMSSFIAVHGGNGFKNPKRYEYIYKELAKFRIT